MKGTNSRSAEQITGTTPPRLLKQYPHAIIVCNLQFVQATLLKPNPQGGSVEGGTIGSKEIYFDLHRATVKLPPQHVGLSI